MPEYLSPGVYVEEVDTGAKPIEGVSTSTAGFVGMTVRGPSVGLPQLVTSFADYQRKFGGYFDGSLPSTYANNRFLPYAISGFFTNGGQRAYVLRVKPSDAATATLTAKGGLVTRLTGDSAAGATELSLRTVRGIIARTAAPSPGTMIMLRQIKDGVVTDSAVVEVTAVNRRAAKVTVSAAIAAAFEARYTAVLTDVLAINGQGLVSAMAGPTSVRPNTLRIDARDEGSWGNRLVMQAFHESAGKAELDTFVSGAAGDNKIRLRSAAGFYVNAWVEIDRGQTKRYRKVVAVNGPVIQLDGPALAAADVAPELAAPNNVTLFATCEFRLQLAFDDVVEEYSGLTLENVAGRYVVDRINNSSTLISVPAAGLPANTHPLVFPSGDDGLHLRLGGGSDGTAALTDGDYEGVDNGPGRRTGIVALEDIDQVSIIACPGVPSQRVQSALINQCELLKDRFAILDPGNSTQTLDQIQSQRALYDTRYAAIYYPRLMVFDPVTEIEIAAPPSGHMAGIYARSDVERGVHKAPANEVVRGISRLELTINKREHDILNPSPRNINVLRDFRSSGRGNRVWGARVITSDPDWKYVNVRRLFIFIEESIEEGTQWVVFEPNDEPLWARVRRSVTDFLTNVWRDGALQGRKADEAFFVRCDRTTMTQYDIDNGRLIMKIGIAPVKPAEFVIFRIGQWAGGSEITE